MPFSSAELLLDFREVSSSFPLTQNLVYRHSYSIALNFLPFCALVSQPFFGMYVAFINTASEPFSI